MLKIISRNDDGVRLENDFDSSNAFIDFMDNDDDCLGDNEILLVVIDNMVVYSSLGNKTVTYNDTVRTMEVYDWLK